MHNKRCRKERAPKKRNKHSFTAKKQKLTSRLIKKEKNISVFLNPFPTSFQLPLPHIQFFGTMTDGESYCRGKPHVLGDIA